MSKKKFSIKDQVERLVFSVNPNAEIGVNTEAGTIIISEWHVDCDPESFVVPEHSAVKFARYYVRTRAEHLLALAHEAARLTTPEDRKRIRASFKKWKTIYPARMATPTKDQRAPGGVFAYSEVVEALISVRDKLGKDEALDLLSKHGGGVTSVRALPVQFYDPVTQACLAATAGESAGGNTIH